MSVESILFGSVGVGIFKILSARVGWVDVTACKHKLLAAVKKRGKLADIDDGKRPSILVNKKGAR